MLPTLALALLPVHSTAAPTRATPPAPLLRASDESLVDEAYRFRIVARRRGESLLGPEEARELTPDAVAMLVSHDSTVAAIVPEYAPDSDLAELTSFLAESIANTPGVSEFEASPPAETEHQGRRAFDATITCTIDGVPIRYYMRVYANGDYVFQVLAWSGLAEADDGDLVALVDRFEVLPGEVTGRRSDARTKDADGVGWRVKDGVFESVVIGARLEARGPWRLVTGFELAQMDDFADVAMVTSEPDAYCTITVYPGEGGPDGAAMATELAEDLVSEYAYGGETEPEGEPVEVSVLGGTLVLDSFVVDLGVEIRMLHGALALDGDVLEVSAWAPLRLAAEGLADLEDGLAGLSLMDSEAVDALTQEMLEAPDAEVQFGVGFGLRGGVYTDFECGFSLRKPDALWTFTCGAEAASAGDFLRVVGHDIVDPIGVNVEVVPWEDDDLAWAHATSLVDEWGAYSSIENLPAPVALEIDGQRLLLTDVPADPSGPGDAGAVDMRVVTALRGGRRIEVAVQNLGAGADTFDAAAEALLDGLGFPARGTETRATRTGFEDRRLGFTLRAPGAGWKGEQMPLPEGIAGIASGYMWSKPFGNEVFLIAIGLGNDIDPEPVASTILRQITSEQGGAKTRRSGTFDGADAKVLTTRRLFRRGVFTVFTRRGRAFVAGAVGGDDHAELLSLLEECVTVED